MNPLTSRPKVVTVIAWLIIAKAALLAVPTLIYLIPSIRDEGRELLQSQGYSFAISIAWALVGAAVRVVCGVALLRRQAWGRVLYFAYIPVAYLLTLYLYGFKPKDLFGLVVFGIFVVLLTRPPVLEYFSARHEPANA
jgi:hypothetical protein